MLIQFYSVSQFGRIIKMILILKVNGLQVILLLFLFLHSVQQTYTGHLNWFIWKKFYPMLVTENALTIVRRAICVVFVSPRATPLLSDTKQRAPTHTHTTDRRNSRMMMMPPLRSSRLLTTVYFVLFVRFQLGWGRKDISLMFLFHFMHSN